jgi:hypothetical protein
MHATVSGNSSPSPSLPNGAGAAALLSAGIGSVVLAVVAILGDRLAPFRKMMNLYNPTGPLSGVTTLAILVWLAAWILLHLRWRRRNVPLRPVSIAALLLLVVGFLLTFPPIADLF